ncbi:sodium-dependent bicarbonate transport family permease [Alkalibacillus aidingensis]|uniref:sodium-dependent bicarbonate transport family permease n=1 Tax=Alkalibacillus aidingensis TaxID=2747607 RepID=UPI00166075F1|nr:sodium-dependent bicarbonate transport family permease [Alkalibacillus aidingensis]
MFDIMVGNLLSPVVLFFLLGMISAIFKSDLKFPDGLSEALSIYLLVAIGLKGGIELSHYSINEAFQPILGTLFLGLAIPVITLFAMRLMGIDFKNSVGLAATYGSVSIVTYGAAISFLDEQAISYEGLMNAMVVLLESPAILFSLLIYNILSKNGDQLTHSHSLGIMPSSISMIDKEVLRESILGKSIVLLVGSLLIGLIAGEQSLPTVEPLFLDLYDSILILFLLNMGLIAGSRLPEIRSHGLKLVLFSIIMPIIGGTLGVLTGYFVGLSVGGSALMGVLAGSASYIAAPAALRTSVPEANPSIYLGLSLGVTFPFNLTIGIPLYFQLAQFIH